MNSMLVIANGIEAIDLTLRHHNPIDDLAIPMVPGLTVL